MWGWHEVSLYLLGPHEMSTGIAQEPNFEADVLGNAAQQFRVLNWTKFTAHMAILETTLSVSSKHPPILNIRPQCTSLTLLLHRMTTFGMNGRTFHWTCHPLPPPRRQSTPHWFLMAVFWQGAQLKRKGKRLLCPSRQKKAWEIIAKWAQRVTNSTDSCLLLHSSHLKTGRKEGESCLWCF